MAITQWDPLSLPIQPGLYTNFKDAAGAQIKGGERGIVALPLKKFTGSKVAAKSFYTVTTEKEAAELFGDTNITSIKLILAGGAKQVLVYVMPATPVADDYTAMRESFEAWPFNVFVYDGEATSAELDATKQWVAKNRTEKKHFSFVTGGSAADDLDPTIGNARSTAMKDDYIFNLVVGGSANGANYSSGQYAAYLAGLIASTPLNKSITYKTVPLADVNRRYRNIEIDTALKAGSLLLINDGEQVKVVQGVATSGAKLRKIRARQAVATDLEKAARDNYIGKLDNNEDGRAFLISAIKAYLEELEKNNVLTDIAVGQDTQNPSKGDEVFLSIAYTEIDSMERIFLSIATN